MKPIYVIQEHHAEKAGLHYDLRLQVNDVLFSWVIKKDPIIDIGTTRLAIRQPDHALSWATFKGRIKEGYGKGLVKIYDKGHYMPLKLSKGKMLFEIHGKKLKGIYSLSKGKDDKNWFFKKEGELDDI